METINSGNLNHLVECIYGYYSLITIFETISQYANKCALVYLNVQPKNYYKLLAQSANAVEYTNCISVEG